MTVVISALAFLVLLSFLVFIHECGHYFAARMAGVVVEEFGFGIPPRAKTLFHFRGTRFSINWIPFGGFVRLKGENAATERGRKAPGSFGNASIPARVMILVAGVFMNFVFALFIFTLGFSLWHWIPSYLSANDVKQAASRGEIILSEGVRLVRLVPEGTAARVHVPVPSTLLAVDGQSVVLPPDVVELQKGKQSVVYTLRSAVDATKTIAITVPVREGRTGVEIESPDVTSPRRSFPQAFMISLRESYIRTELTIRGMYQLLKSVVWQQSIPEGITGPVGIAVLTRDSVEQGFVAYLQLAAMISLGLAILNILPFPSLDGGRLLFVLIEGIARRPAPRRFELITNAVGFLVLILLIVLVTFNDIWKLF